jgi:hypothetical protein
MRIILNEKKVPFKSKNEDLKLKFVNLFNDYLKKFSVDKVDVDLIDKLTEDEVVNLYEYINKTYEFIPLGEQNIKRSFFFFLSYFFTTKINFS